MNIGTVEGTLRLRDEFTSRLKLAASQLQETGKRMEQVGRGMSSAGAALTKSLTLPLALIGGGAVRAFGDFDAAMTKSLAIMGQVDEAMRTRMATAAREVAKETKFSATQAAESYFFLASAGLDAATSVAALPKVARFAQAGMFDMALATDLLTDAQSALGLTIRDDVTANMENLARVSDVLVKANTLANATVEQFSTSLTTEAGAALKSFNVDVEEGVAVLAAFADQGVKGQVAGTGLSRILRLMTTAAVENADAYERLGVEVFDSAGNIVNLAEIVEDLEQALGGLSDAERVAALQALGFQARIQGVILPLLGTSDAIRRYEKELRAAGGTTETVADKQMEALLVKLGLLKDKFVDAFITLGSAIAPSIIAFSNTVLIPLIELLGRLSERFSDLPAPVRHVALVVATLAAAAGPVLFLSGQLVGSWATLVLFAPRVAGAISLVGGRFTALAVAGGPLFLVIAALTAINELIKKVGDSFVEETNRIVQQTNRFREPVAALAEQVESGIIDVAVIKRAETAFNELVDERMKAQKRLEDFIESGGKKLAEQGSRSHQKRLHELEAESSQYENQEAQLYRLIERASLLAKTKSDGAGEPPILDKNDLKAQAEALDLVLGILSPLREASESLARQNEALQLAKTAEEFELVALAVEMGIDPVAALNESFTVAGINIRERLENIRDLRKGVDENTRAWEEWEEQIGAAADRYTRIELDPKFFEGIELPDPIEPSGFFNGAAFGDYFEQMGEDLKDHMSSGLQERLDAIWANSARNMQEAFGDAITSFLRQGEVDFESFFDTIAGIGATMLSEQLSAAITAIFQGNKGAFGELRKSMEQFSSTASGMAALGLGTIATIATAENPDYAAVGAALGAAVGAGLASYALGGMGTAQGAAWGAQIGAMLGSMIKKGAPKFFATLEGELGQVDFAGSLAALAPGIGDELQAGIEKVAAHLGGEFRSLAAGITFETREGMKVVVGGIAHYFEKGDWASGIQFAIVEALKRADITGISAEAKAALQNTVADTMEELLSDLDFARFVETLGMDEVAVKLDDFALKFSETWTRMVDLGIDGAERLERWAVESLESQRNAILGITETEEERIRRQAAAFNHQLKILEAEQLARRADLLMRRAELEADLKISEGHAALVEHRLRVDGAFLAAESELVKAKIALYTATLQALEAIDALLASLPGMEISLGDVNAAVRRAGGGFNKAKADAERLEEMLASSARQGMGEWQGRLVDINEHWDDAIPLAHKNAEALERIADARERETAALREQLRTEVEPFLPGIQLGGFSPDGSALNVDTGEWAARVEEIIGWSEDLAEANLAMLEETGMAAFTAEELAAATHMRMVGLAEEAIGSLGLPLEQTREQLRQLGQALAFLESQVAAGIISQGRYADVVAQVAQQQFLALGDALLGFLDRYYGDVAGYEDFRQRLEMTRFQLELANLRLQFELVKGLRILTDETVAFIEDTFDWIDANLPEFPVPGTGAGGGGGGLANVVPINSHPDFQRERDRAREMLEGFRREGMDPLTRALMELEESFDFIRQQLGNTAEVQAEYAAALERIMRQHLEGIADLQQDLFLGSDSPFSVADRLATSRQLFESAVARFQAGDLSVISEIPQLVQQYLAAAREFFPQGSAGYEAIFRLVNGFLNEVLATGNLPGLQIPGPPPAGGSLPGLGPGGASPFQAPGGSSGQQLYSIDGGQISQAQQDGNALLRSIDFRMRDLVVLHRDGNRLLTNARPMASEVA
jgi:TP901 family phage tail tape measure protein